VTKRTFPILQQILLHELNMQENFINNFINLLINKILKHHLLFLLTKKINFNGK